LKDNLDFIGAAHRAHLSAYGKTALRPYLLSFLPNENGINEFEEPLVDVYDRDAHGHAYLGRRKPCALLPFYGVL
jgi:hypothetical protein